MNVSIVVTCYNEEKNIRGCLDSLIHQDYNLGDYEIIVSDGNSSDRTQPIVKECIHQFSKVKLVIETKRGTAAGRNAGIKAAGCDYVAFIDADCEAPSNWLSGLAENFKRIKSESDKVAAVGGRNISPKTGDNFIRAIEIVLDSYIGSFNSIQGRQLNSSAFVSSLSTANALYDKKSLIEVGCFDESLMSEAEDADINYRLSSRGYLFLFVPNSFVWHKMRATPLSWLKNMFRYGKGRARLLKRYPGMWNISFLLPILFILAMASIILSVFLKIFYIPLLYFPFILLFSLYQCKRKKTLHLVFIVAYIYIIHHLAYSLGELYGLTNYRVK